MKSEKLIKEEVMNEILDGIKNNIKNKEEKLEKLLREKFKIEFERELEMPELISEDVELKYRNLDVDCRKLRDDINNLKLKCEKIEKIKKSF